MLFIENSEDKLNQHQRNILRFLGILKRSAFNIGDITLVIWCIHAITEFEADPTYPFLGLKGLIFILLIYMLGIAISVQRESLRNKYEQQ